MAFWMGCSSPLSAASPSTVESSWPLACTANIRQERTATPSTSIVHAPQTPCSQPTWVPASSNSWRRKSESSVRDSTLLRYAVPLTDSSMSCRSGCMADPLMRRADGAADQDAGDMALVIGTSVDVARRRDRVLHLGCDRVDRLVGQALP